MLKTVYFERVSLKSILLIAYYRKRGYKIKTFNFYHDLRRNKHIRKLIDNRRLESFFPLGCNKRYGQILDVAEEIYSQSHFDNAEKCFHPMIGDQESHLVLKKSILNEVYRTITVDQKLDGLIKENDIFIPDSYFQGLKKLRLSKRYKPSFDAKKHIPLYISILNFLQVFASSFKWKFVALGFITSKFLAKIAVGFFRRTNLDCRLDYKYAVPIDQSFQLNFTGKRSFDFICDHKDINKENTVFLLNFKVPKDWLDTKLAENYNFLDVSNKNLGSENYFKVSSKDISNFLKSTFRFLLTNFKSTELLKGYIQTLNEYITWSPFVSKIKLNNYIYTNQDGISQIVKNILLHNNGTTTWNYSSFVGGCLLVSPTGDFNDVRDGLWGFQNANNFLAVNDDVIKYYKLHKQTIKNYVVIGSLYSEMVSSWNNEKLNDEKVNIFQKYSAKENKILSFFDTTFINDEECLTSFKDGLHFYQDVLHVAENNPQYLIILKPSKNKDFYMSPASEWGDVESSREMLKIWDKLDQMENVFFPGNSGESTLIMAISDLVVTHCMSSPCVEALGAGVKSIWYESGEKHKGVLYSKIPNLIVHGREALLAQIERYLHEVSDEEYKEYLKKHIVGTLVNTVEANALSEFRKLLINND